MENIKDRNTLTDFANCAIINVMISLLLMGDMRRATCLSGYGYVIQVSSCTALKVTCGKSNTSSHCHVDNIDG